MTLAMALAAALSPILAHTLLVEPMAVVRNSIFSSWALAERKTLIEFLDGYLAPFLREVGSMWAGGKLEVRHEHLSSEVVKAALRRAHARLTSRQPGSPRATLLLANLPGEEHGIGLKMLDLAVRELGLESTFLGADTPLEEIARAADELGARWVGISISLANGGPAASRAVRDLRAKLDPSRKLVVRSTPGGRLAIPCCWKASTSSHTLVLKRP